MLFEEIKGHGITKIFLLVGSYTILSWQFIKEVLIAVYQHKAQFNLFGFLSLCELINLCSNDAGTHRLCSKFTYYSSLALHLLYSEGMDSTIMLNCLHTLIVHTSLHSSYPLLLILTFGIEIENMNGCEGHK